MKKGKLQRLETHQDDTFKKRLCFSREISSDKKLASSLLFCAVPSVASDSSQKWVWRSRKTELRFHIINEWMKWWHKIHIGGVLFIGKIIWVTCTFIWTCDRQVSGVLCNTWRIIWQCSGTTALCVLWPIGLSLLKMMDNVTMCSFTKLAWIWLHWHGLSIWSSCHFLLDINQIYYYY